MTGNSGDGNKLLSTGIRNEIERIRQIYCLDVLKKRSREVHLPGRRCAPQIMHTFLGYEVKVGRRRLTCPDIHSAKYLSLFAEIGMKTIQIPYQPDRVALLVPGLEHALSRIKAEIITSQPEERRRRVAVGRIYKQIREACRCDTANSAASAPIGA